MNITVLVEDRSGDPCCLTEHGLSLLISHADCTLLLDCGQSDAFLHNAKALGIDLHTIPLMVLSHGHYDHGGGLEYITGKTIYCHPNCFTKRYSITTKNSYAGLKVDQTSLGQRNTLLLSPESCQIAEDIFFLTAIPRLLPFEAKQFPTILEDGSKDTLFDDSGLAINTPEGVIVITGCAHSGICNIIEHAKTVCQNDFILAVIGGFHLREVNDDLDQVVSYLRNLKARYLITGHCTCDAAYDILQQRIAGPTQVKLLGAGKSFSIK